MRHAFKCILLAPAALVVLSCTESYPTPPPYATAPAVFSSSGLPPPPPSTKAIQILSEPPGARIEVNDDYIGDAPCTVQVRCDINGRFFEDTRISALPVGYGYVQSKRFTGFGQTGITSLPSDPIPARIFFDMRLGPASPDINVNVNQ